MPNFNDAVADLSRQLEVGLRNYMQSDEYTKYLDVMSNFHTYSYRNTALIAMQKPDASQVCGYKTWQKMNRQVRKGEKAIRIFAPMRFNEKKKEPVIDEKTGEPLKNPDGTAVSEENAKAFVRFRPVSVFDISQTDGEDLPRINVKQLTDPVANYDKYFKAIEATSPVPIRFDSMPIGSTANGYYDTESKEIVIRKGMPEAQTLKTAVHEMTHAKLHDRDATGHYTNQQTREVEAESTAYIVCKHFGLSTDDYTFPYIAAWSDKADLSTLNDSMTAIQKTASSIITGITEELDIERRQNLIDTMRAAGYERDAERSDPFNLFFNREDGATVQMKSWDEVDAYVHNVVLSDPDVPDSVKAAAAREYDAPNVPSQSGIEKAAEAIKAMYGDKETPDFSDPRHVDVLFTYEGQPKQYSADLIGNRINVYDVTDYLDYGMQNKDEPADKYGTLIESRQYANTDELISKGIPEVYKENGMRLGFADKKESERQVGNVVYAPVYDQGWKVVALPLDECKFYGKNDIVYNGKIYSNEVYATEQGAKDYISRSNGEGFRDRIGFDEDTHEPFFVADKYDKEKDARETHAGRQAQKSAHVKTDSTHKRSDPSL